jgi:hypothetical protein
MNNAAINSKFQKVTGNYSMLIAAVLSGCAGLGEVNTLGRYDFSYRIEGEASARPLQIFDDGKKTFIQFREGVPAIMTVNRDNQPGTVASRREGPYIVVDRVEREFVFQKDQDKARARALYIGTQNRAVLPDEIVPLQDTKTVPNSFAESESMRVPFPKDSAMISDGSRRSLEQLLPKAMNAKRIVIFATPARVSNERGVGLMRAAAARRWLVAQGISRARIRVIKNESSAPTPEYCELHLSPFQSPTKPIEVVRNVLPRTRPVVYGPARPTKVSLAVKPIFVDHNFGTTERLSSIGPEK